MDVFYCEKCKGYFPYTPLYPVHCGAMMERRTRVWLIHTRMDRMDWLGYTNWSIRANEPVAGKDFDPRDDESEEFILVE